MNTGISTLRARLYSLYWEVRGGLRDRTRFLLESQRWPRTRLDALRDAKLRTLVAHHYRAVPYYRRMLDESGVRPDDIRGVGDLPRLPILTKETLRRHADELLAPGVGTLEEGVTGGTTGTPTRVVRDLAGTVWQRACYWRGFSWGGLSFGAPWAQLFGGSLGVQAARRLNRLKNWFAGKVFLPAFELSSGNVARYVAAIRDADARHLVGYTSACYLLAQLVERAGLSLRLAAVFPTAEMLPPQWAETMARVFGAKILPYYGCGEVESIAYSCPDASEPSYHTCDEHVAVEADADGAFLVTDLDNLAMPLIRYRNGDAGVLAEPGCACGRSLGRIVRLDGRVNDVLLTTSGGPVSGAIGPHAFRLTRGVDAFQIVQRRPGQVILRVVRADGYDPDVEEPKLRGIFVARLGADAEVDFEYVAAIAKTAAGKSRFVINEYLESRRDP